MTDGTLYGREILPGHRTAMIELEHFVISAEMSGRHVDAADIRELASSLLAHGQLQPVICKHTDDPRMVVLIAGYRRWLASKSAGLPQLEVLFVEKDADAEAIRLVENLLRKAMPPPELALALQRFSRERLWTYEKIGQAFGMSTSTVSSAIKIADLDARTIQLLTKSKYPMTLDAWIEFARIDDHDLRESVLQDALCRQLTRDQIRAGRKARKGGNAVVAKCQKQLSAVLEALNPTKGAARAAIDADAARQLQDLVEQIAALLRIMTAKPLGDPT